jgi:hypothetical protein
MPILRTLKWLLFAGGASAVYCSLATMFLVPGVYDSTRALVIGFFLSLAANCFLLSGMLFVDTGDGSFATTRRILKTAPAITMLVSLLVEVVFALTVSWRR